MHSLSSSCICAVPVSLRTPTSLPSTLQMIQLCFSTLSLQSHCTQLPHLLILALSKRAIPPVHRLRWWLSCLGFCLEPRLRQLFNWPMQIMLRWV